MKSRDEIFNIYLQLYASDKQVEVLRNPFYIPNEQSVIESINNTEQKYINYLPEIVLNEDEKEYVINKIKSIHSIYQEEGHAILGDYEHDYKWYDRWLDENNEQYYWERYKNYLVCQKHFPPSVVETLENKTLKSIMSYLGDPNGLDSNFSIRGLVVGDVQSGKTSNYLGLLTKAADAGYKVIFVLTGTIESLRKQTQERVEEGFIGYNVVDATDVGVGRGDKTPKSFTSRKQDFVDGNDLNTTMKISSYNFEPMVFVVKKNVSVLKKMYAAIKNINTTKQYQKINTSMLLIDDEADNASINTNKEDNDPTKINNYIRKILNLFERSSYVGFTATPFANVFISYDDENEMLKDDLFPRDFIYSLNAPSNYCGSRKYFFEKNDNVRFITDSDDSVFPMKHSKEWYGDNLFQSFYHSINTFLLANTIRDLRDPSPNTNRSMLINMTRFTKVQLVIKEIVDAYYIQVKNAIKQTHKLDSNYALTNPLISGLKESFDKEYSTVIIDGSYLSWELVFKNIYNSIKDIQIVVVNSSKQSTKLNYDDYKTTGLRVIAIGGLALSRGLTLEGLCVSYFYRNTSTFDVLMQMGRWFGYRDGYEDLCKIFITQISSEYYKDICKSIECLREDIVKMEEQHKKPSDYGIRVRNDSIDLGITASNKMRNTAKKVDRKSFYGNIFETPYLYRNLDLIENNINETKLFFDKIDIESRDYNVSHPYFRNISKNYVIELLSHLNVHPANENFDISQLCRFIKRQDKELDNFDLLIMEGFSNSNRLINVDALHLKDISLVARSFDVPNENLIRISEARARLGGRSDAKNGLKPNETALISDNVKGQDYMIEGRNPLLIIYFIDPRNDGFDNEDRFTSTSNITDEIKLYCELLTRKYSYLIGFAIGFPYKAGVTGENTMYTVNKTVNYFEKDHEEMEDEDCNE